MYNKARFKKRIRTVLSAVCVLAVTIGNSEYANADVNSLLEPNGEYVVVIDPGHDSKHSGAGKNGLREEIITMKISQMCKAELEKNENITVYLTHDTLACPYPGGKSTDCNKYRCDYAGSLGADLLISIHINSANEKYKNGFEIYYPTSNYIPEIHVEGYEMAMSVAERLKNVIPRYNGMYMRDSDENKYNDENFYPDGTRADYYNIIRNSKYNNFPGIIVEHGYISNYSDAVSYLSSDEGLYRLAKADADGIMDYLEKVEKRKNNEQKCKEALENWSDNIIHSPELMSNIKDEESFYSSNILSRKLKFVFKPNVDIHMDPEFEDPEIMFSDMGIIYFDVIKK